jgi:peptidoglycan/LPS O-acetylase OafA/YrhL
VLPSLHDHADLSQGLRGIAALYVVSSHVVLCYDLALVNPCCEDGRPKLFQRPIFRLVASGHSWVAVFFILMGFVNALKPLSLARSGKADLASAKLAESAFSRVLRLMLPAAFATCFSWLLCQFGLYELSRQSDAFWLSQNTPQASSNIFAAFVDLKDAISNTWLLATDNQYDQPQWALIYLLLGSLMTILVLLMTVKMTPLWRTVTLVILALTSIDWSHHIGDPWAGITCFSGIILADFSLSNLPTNLAAISPVLSPPLAIFALVLMSYPSSMPSVAPWSAFLEQFGTNHFGNWALDRMYGSIGAILLAAAILISPHARMLLSLRPFKWLGKISFAIYLLHGTFMRTIFAWVLFVGSEKQEFQEKIDLPGWDIEQFQAVWKYPVPGFFRCCVATIALLASTLSASHLWNMKIEPICARLSTLVDKLVKGQLTGDEALNLAGRSPSEKQTILPMRKD